MSSSMSVDGLVSGLSTSSLIDSLMQVESAPQAALQQKVANQSKVVSAYQAINSKMAALVTAAKALGGTDIWGAMKATSTSDAAVATSSSGAATGSLSFHVDSLAANHTVTFAGRVGATSASIMSGSTLDVKLADGTSTTVTPTSGSLSDVVKSINGTTNAAYTASAVQVAPGQYTLQLTAKKSGAAESFSSPVAIDGLGAETISSQGTDAQITVGTTTPYTVTSSTNTFADVLPGVSITAVRKQAVGEANAVVSVGADADKVAASVKNLIDTANAALSEISKQTVMNPATATGGKSTAGALAGDFTMRTLEQNILDAVSGGAGALGSLRAVGIETTRDGQLTFDQDKFKAAYTADAAKTQSYFDSYTDVAHVNANAYDFDPGWDQANGIARKLQTIGLRATEGVRLPTNVTAKKEGLLQGLINRQNEYIGNLNDQVSEWDIRLDMRKTALQKQFASLETALSSMKNQSSWLAGQIAGLPTSG